MRLPDHLPRPDADATSPERFAHALGLEPSRITDSLRDELDVIRRVYRIVAVAAEDHEHAPPDDQIAIGTLHSTIDALANQLRRTRVNLQPSDRKATLALRDLLDSLTAAFVPVHLAYARTHDRRAVRAMTRLLGLDTFDTTATAVAEASGIRRDHALDLLELAEHHDDAELAANRLGSRYRTADVTLAFEQLDLELTSPLASVSDPGAVVLDPEVYFGIRHLLAYERVRTTASGTPVLAGTPSLARAAGFTRDHAPTQEGAHHTTIPASELTDDRTVDTALTLVRECPTGGIYRVPGGFTRAVEDAARLR